MKLLVAAVAVGCGSPPTPSAPPSNSPPAKLTCREAIDHVAAITKVTDDDQRKRMREESDVLVKHCESDGWTDATIQCLHDAATQEASEKCAGMLTQAQLQALASPHDDPKQLATKHAKMYAFEAYPQWAAAHPDKACPGALVELREFTPFDSDDDPWGHPYKLMCGPSLPAGAKGIAIQSAGPDGQFDTADDVRSWE